METLSTFNVPDPSATFLGNDEELLRQWKSELTSTPTSSSSSPVLVKVIDILLGLHTADPDPSSKQASHVIQNNSPHTSRKRKRGDGRERPEVSAGQTGSQAADTCSRVSADDCAEPERKKTRREDNTTPVHQQPRRPRQRPQRSLRVTVLKRVTFTRKMKDSVICCWDDCCSRWRRRFRKKGF